MDFARKYLNYSSYAMCDFQPAIAGGGVKPRASARGEIAKMFEAIEDSDRLYFIGLSPAIAGLVVVVLPFPALSARGFMLTPAIAG